MGAGDAFLRIQNLFFYLEWQFHLFWVKIEFDFLKSSWLFENSISFSDFPEGWKISFHRSFKCLNMDVVPFYSHMHQGALFFQKI